MKNISTKLLLFFVFLLFSFYSEAAVNPPVNKVKSEKQFSKKAELRNIKEFKKLHKAEMKGMSAKEKKTFIFDGISKQQFIPNGWLPVGIVLVIVGGIMALFGGVIAIVGGAVALVGLAFVVVWLVKEVNSSY